MKSRVWRVIKEDYDAEAEALLEELCNEEPFIGPHRPAYYATCYVGGEYGYDYEGPFPTREEARAAAEELNSMWQLPQRGNA